MRHRADEDPDARVLILSVAMTLHVAVLRHLRRKGLLDADDATTIWNQALWGLPPKDQNAGAVVLRQLMAGLDEDILPPPQD